MKKPKFIISGGGTGGHIFPAISIANALRAKLPTSEILFVGAEGKMEMERVPKEGYEIIGLPIRGFQRKKIFTFPSVLWKLFQSLRKAKGILKKYKPSVVIGVGGYASSAVLYKASGMKIPTLIQEQNSYPGMTNRLLSSRVDKVCVAYDKMERFFSREKIVLAGNPIRQDLIKYSAEREIACKYYNLSSTKKTILCVGGSLGARTLNDSLLNAIKILETKDVQIIWQTGAYYYEQIMEKVGVNCPRNIHIYKFLDRMDLAYAVADLVVSRAGAIAISELSVLGKATILVPSPNVAEDHQTKNAMALVEKDAAVLVRDVEAREKLVSTMFSLVVDEVKLKKLSDNIKGFAYTDASDTIADEIIRLMKSSR